MDSQEFVNFTLPEEIWENILCRLLLEPSSNEDLTNFRLVCKDWNSRIKSNSHLWNVACQQLGLNVKKKAPDEEINFRSIFLRMRKRFRQMKNGGEFFFAYSLYIYSEIRLTYFHNGILAIGRRHSFHLFDVNQQFVPSFCGVDLMGYGCPSCIQFDDSYLVVGTKDGDVITFKMPTIEKLHSKMSPTGPISCLTFNKDLNLLATASDKIVTLWCLSSGTVHFTRTINTDYEIFELQLIFTPDLQNGCDCVLLCMNDTSCYRFLLNSQQITSANVDPFVLFKLSSEGYILNCHFASPFLYFTHSTFESQLSTLFKCDLVSGKLEVAGLFKNSDDLKLVGVGKKYACLIDIRANEEFETQRVIIYDLSTESEFASVIIPSRNMGLIFHLGDGRWLNGFDGFNDNGVVFVNQNENGTCSVMRWPDLN